MSYQVLCECCSDIAVEFESSIEDGLKKHCDSCGILGAVSIECDEDGTYVRFWPLDGDEAMNLDTEILLEAYLKGQELIDRLMTQTERLLNENKQLKKELGK